MINVQEHPAVVEAFKAIPDKTAEDIELLADVWYYEFEEDPAGFANFMCNIGRNTAASCKKLLKKGTSWDEILKVRDRAHTSIAELKG